MKDAIDHEHNVVLPGRINNIVARGWRKIGDSGVRHAVFRRQGRTTKYGKCVGSAHRHAFGFDEARPPLVRVAWSTSASETPMATDRQCSAPSSWFRNYHQDQRLRLPLRSALNSDKRLSEPPLAVPL